MICTKCNGTGYIDQFEDTQYIRVVCDCDLTGEMPDVGIPFPEGMEILIDMPFDQIDIDKLQEEQIIIQRILDDLFKK